MDTQQFLARVIAPGNFVAIAHKKPGHGGMSARFFPHTDIHDAASWADWLAKHGNDVYHAVASYRMASPDGTDKLGHPKFIGERTRANAHNLKAFWIDVDIARPGDGKDRSRIYPDLGALIMWLRSFMDTTKIPAPNMWVNSGYGMHLYWLLEDAMTVADWQPYADALGAALDDTGALVDAHGFCTDAARILRPAGTVNLKVPADPHPVGVVQSQSRSDYPNQLILDALKPWLGKLVTHASAATGTHGAALGSGGASTVFAARQGSNVTPLTQAAQANLPMRREYSFATIATKCAQVGQDLATGGAGVDRPIWYLGHLSLAVFCADGEPLAHDISKGDSRYDVQTVKNALIAIRREKDTKGGGAPTCAYYNTQRPGVCSGCKWAGRINSPLTLGTVDGDGDLPESYRRSNGNIEKMIKDKEGHKWVPVFTGDVYGPTLTTKYQLKFTYERAKTAHSVFVDPGVMHGMRGGMAAYFHDYKVTLNRENAQPFGDFVVAWIEKLRDLRVDLHEDLEPFGWVCAPGGQPTGIAVGGTIYRPDGSIEESLQPARGVTALYQPSGDLAKWIAACETFTRGRVDLQMIVGAAFGAPLVRYTSQPGCTISVWSQGSGRGKSSAFLLGHTVWGKPSGMCGMGDTINSVRTKLGAARFMPAYWDEIKISNDKPEASVNFFFDVAQGKDKSRLDANAELRETHTWQTLFLCSGNRPLMEYVRQTHANTEAGDVRLFEIELDHPPVPHSIAAEDLLAQVQHNYGHAGRIYAQHLITNEAQVAGFVRTLRERIAKEVKSTANERFFVAGIAAVVAGATIANQLGLLKCNPRELLAYMEQKMLLLRGDRQEASVVDGRLNLDDVFGMFYTWAMPRRLDTTHFNRSGQSQRNNKGFIVKQPAVINQPIVVHVGHRDAAMRIDRAVFSTWCKSQNLSGDVVLREMQARWGATVGRTVLGAGADAYATGNIRFIELPLTRPQLSPYLDAAASTTVGKAAPAAALRAAE